MGSKSSILDVFRRIFTLDPFERLLYLAVRGTKYGSNWSRLIPGPHLYPQGKTKQVNRNGITYDLDLSCLMQWYVFWGQTETPRKKLYSLVSSGDIVMDVGTNIGETLLNFARIVGNRGYVYGFEPDSHNFSNVQKNISLNDFKNLRVFNLGVSDRKEVVRLYRVDRHNLGMNRILSDDEATKFSDYTEIEVDTLDNICRENQIDHIDLMKIDIEGFEMHALRGAELTLRRLMPRLFIEVGYTRLLSNGTSPTELISFLNSLGYSIFHSETDQLIEENFDFSPLGDGGIDIYALPSISVI